MTQSLGKILIIEDDRFVRKAYEAKLTLAGFAVITAIDGGEAIELTKTEKLKRPVKWGKAALIALAALLALPIVLLHVMSLNVFIPPIEKLASDRMTAATRVVNKIIIGAMMLGRI